MLSLPLRLSDTQEFLSWLTEDVSEYPGDEHGAVDDGERDEVLVRVPLVPQAQAQEQVHVERCRKEKAQYSHTRMIDHSFFSVYYNEAFFYGST